MTFNIKQAVPLLILSAAIPVGYYATRCGVSSLCPGAPYIHELAFVFFKPLWVFSFFSIPAVIFLPFVKKKVFGIWVRFAAIWIALTILAIIDAPEAINSWFYMIDYTKSGTAEFMGALFSLISLSLLPIATLALYSRSKGYS